MLTDQELDRMAGEAFAGAGFTGGRGTLMDLIAQAQLTIVLQADLARVTAERDTFLAFKHLVHDWLDKAGVPKDPDPDGNAKSGCRISGRMEWLRNDLQSAANRQYDETVNQVARCGAAELECELLRERLAKLERVAAEARRLTNSNRDHWSARQAALIEALVALGAKPAERKEPT
jgi:hypothetical protein